jgi:cobalt transporter subunit CbtB
MLNKATYSDVSIGMESRLAAPIAAMILGLGLLFAVGFLQPNAIHSAAHDARHTAAFPCH